MNTAEISAVFLNTVKLCDRIHKKRNMRREKGKNHEKKRQNNENQKSPFFKKTENLIPL